MDKLNIFVKLFIFYFVIVKYGNTILYQQNSAGLQFIPNITDSRIDLVELRGNAITSIPATALQHLTNIGSINLGSNQISTVSEDAFKYNTGLSVLTLEKNPLKIFPFFPGLNGVLKKLDLEECLITNDSWNLVVPYSNLADMTMNYNDIKHVPDLNMSKSTITNLYLEGCGITDIRPNHFYGYDKLKSLLLENNKFVTLQDYSFAGLGALATLDLERNRQLISTEWFAFSGLRNLLNLKMGYGEALTAFPCVGVFSPKLTKLELNSNKIENCPANCSDFRNLESFLLKNNNMQDNEINNALKSFAKVTSFDMYRAGKLCLELDALNALQSLTQLELQEDQMKYIPVKNCSATEIEPDDRSLDLPSLTDISFYSNQLENHPNITLLINLKKLDLRKNKLTHIQKNVYINNEKLQTIDLRENLLIEAPDLAGACKSLVTLDLEYNKISKLPSDYFKGCLLLTTVKLNYNSLTSVPDFSVGGENLKEIQLRSNQISGIVKANNFRNLFRVKRLHLQSNKITDFDISCLKYLPDIEQIDLSDNQLNKMDNPYRWCQGQACMQLTLELYNNENILCDETLCWSKRTPNPMTTKMNDKHCFGKKWDDVTLEDLNCPGVRIMEVASREDGAMSFQNTLPVGFHVPRQSKDVATDSDCALWCSDVEDCVYFEHEPKTKSNREGVCMITDRFN